MLRYRSRNGEGEKQTIHSVTATCAKLNGQVASVRPPPLPAPSPSSLLRSYGAG